MMQPVTRFPNRIYHVVWRNWDTVPVAQLASLLGGPAAEVRRLARDLGLRDQPGEVHRHRKRFRSLIIRRNWHLLPLSQIAELVGMSEEALRTFMREDDFLDVKLPPKPLCRLARFRVPTPAQRRAACEIARELADIREPPGVEPAFAFLGALRSGRGDVVPPRLAAAGGRALTPRIMHPYDAPHNASAFDPENTPISYLRLMKEFGADSLWFPAVLFNLIQLPGYPEFGKDRRTLLPKIRGLMERMDRAGLRLYLYICEPRSQPAAFFQRHPGVRGVRGRADSQLYHICTSTPQGQELVRDGIASLCRSLPGLGGVIDISASEYPTHCWSHGYGAECPRCGRRRPADVLCELLQKMQEGIDTSGQKCELIAWNWGWQWALKKRKCSAETDITRLDLAPDARGYVFQRLPGRVTPLLNFEYGTRVRCGGVENLIWEYSISHPAQGPYTAVQKRAIDRLKRPALARIQISTSTEFVGAPYLPVPQLAAEKIGQVRKKGYAGFMGSWIFGGYPSPNLLVARAMSDSAGQSPQEAVRRVAAAYYGRRNSELVLRAWKRFSDALRLYPSSIPLQYCSPLHVAPAVEWSLQPTGQPSRMYYPSDDPEAYCAPYSPDAVAARFQRIAGHWAEGLVTLRKALERSDAAHRTAAERDYGVAETFWLCCMSLVNHIRFCSWRHKAASDPAVRERVRRLVLREMEIAERYYRRMRRDSRIGFEASMQYFAQSNDVREKILGLRQITRSLEEMEE